MGKDGLKEDWWRQKRWWIPVLLLVVGSLVLVIVGPPAVIRVSQPDIRTASAADQLKAENDLRGTLVTMLAGLAVAGGSIVAALNFANSRAGLAETQRQNRETSELQRRGQVTERFSRAIDQLGEAEKLDVRLGAIYALEQIARDSSELHWPIVEILTAFIRQHTKTGAGGGQPEHHQSPAASEVPADIQAALTVLGRRNSDNDRGKIDLTQADLQGARLSAANLQGADFGRANLQGALLIGANLQGALLIGANLQGAELDGANLQGAIAMGANFQGAELTQADLQGAMLAQAALQGAQLIEANLKNAALNETQLNDANLRGSNLQGAQLIRANLQRANLDRADLENAGLDRADLEGAVFFGAKMEGARLSGTDLQDADLRRANLQGAKFNEANLQGARLGQADLQFAVGLGQKQLDSAISDETTKVPPGLTIKRVNSEETGAS
jgi:uncharacterized protein YjbI with pentapeptide repeats/membrane protein implicated in regulation of membrane protease activity